MAEQTGKNIKITFKAESTFNEAPGAGSGTVLRLNPSPGLGMARPLITPNEIRSDGQTPMARLGSRSVTGSFSGDLSRTSFDIILEAVLRGTWKNAVTLSNSDSNLTSITTTANTIANSSSNNDEWTDPMGDGTKRGPAAGDVIRISGQADNAQNENNNDKNLRVTAVTDAAITTADTLSVNSADTSFNLIVPRKLVQGDANDRPTRRSFYVEQLYQDLGTNGHAVLFGGCRFHGFTLSGAPDGMATVEFPVTGVSQTTSTAPYYTSVNPATTDGLTFVDAKIRLDGEDIAIATSFDMTLATPASTLPIIGGTSSPDVFDEESTLTGSVTMLRDDLDSLAALDSEEEFELHIVLEGTDVDPKEFISVFVPRLKFTSVEAPLGGAGALVETVGWTAGKREAATGYDAGMLTITTGD